VRYPLLATALFGIARGNVAGLLAAGLEIAAAAPDACTDAWSLMVSGFMATLINLERVVALNRNGCMPHTAATGLGVLALLIGLPRQLADVDGVRQPRHGGHFHRHCSGAPRPAYRDDGARAGGMAGR